MAKIAGQRMSAETKATRAVVNARGGPVSEPDMHTREYDRVVAEPSLNTSAGPRGQGAKNRTPSRCVRRTSMRAATSSEAMQSEA